MIEEIKKYWDERPCNIRHSDEPVGTPRYWQEVEWKKYFVEPHIPEFAEFKKWKDKRVLEIGCGIGTDAVNFARHGASYNAIDLSNVSLNLVMDRFQQEGLSGAFRVGNAEDGVDFFFNEFDLVYSFGVLHHTPEPHKVLCAARKALKIDGELRIMVYATNSWKNIMIGAGLDQPEAQAGCPLARTYTRDEAFNLLSDCGFLVREMTQAHIFPYNVPRYISGGFEKEPWFRNMPQAMFEALEKRLGWHLLIKAIPV